MTKLKTFSWAEVMAEDPWWENWRSNSQEELRILVSKQLLYLRINPIRKFYIKQNIFTSLLIKSVSYTKDWPRPKATQRTFYLRISLTHKIYALLKTSSWHPNSCFNSQQHRDLVKGTLQVWCYTFFVKLNSFKNILQIRKNIFIKVLSMHTRLLLLIVFWIMFSSF